MNLTRVFTLTLSLLAPSVVCAARSNQKSASAPAAAAIESDPALWKEFSSFDGGFSILMPGTHETTKQIIRLGDAPVELHVHRLTTTADYSVVYADYPVAIDDAASAKAVLDYSAKSAAANSEPSSVIEAVIDGHPGRAVTARMPGGKILYARLLIVGQRLYRAAVLAPGGEGAPSGTEKFYEKAAKKFLDSFKIISDEVDRYLAHYRGEVLDRGRLELTGRGDGKPTPDGISGGRFLSHPVARYPPIALAAGATGAVVVSLVADESGKVIAAHAIKGNPLLRQSAEFAARSTLFEPTTVNGKPTKITGTLTYTFKIVP